MTVLKHKINLGQLATSLRCSRLASLGQIQQYIQSNLLYVLDVHDGIYELRVLRNMAPRQFMNTTYVGLGLAS